MARKGGSKIEAIGGVQPDKVPERAIDGKTYNLYIRNMSILIESKISPKIKRDFLMSR